MIKPMCDMNSIISRHCNNMSEEMVDELLRYASDISEYISSMYKELGDAYNARTYWRDLYNRDVEGLNNEGDPIGGDPPRGMRYYVEYFRKENERLRSLLPPEPPDTEIQACAGAG